MDIQCTANPTKRPVKLLTDVKTHWLLVVYSWYGSESTLSVMLDRYFMLTKNNFFHLCWSHVAHG